MGLICARMCSFSFDLGIWGSIYAGQLVASESYAYNLAYVKPIAHIRNRAN